MVIAIDGPAGVGKTTVGIRLADRLGATFLDTGVLYRALTLRALEEGVDAEDEGQLAALAEQLDVEVGRPMVADGRESDIRLGERDITRAIRAPEVEGQVSQVASHAAVRTALVPAQRRAAGGGYAVVVGRDIGTVIFPDALVKIYLEASADERARRRAGQLGSNHDAEAVARGLAQRDELDSGRAVAPLKPADDAIRVETDDLSVDEVVDRVWQMVKERVPGVQ